MPSQDSLTDQMQRTIAAAVAAGDYDAADWIEFQFGTRRRSFRWPETEDECNFKKNNDCERYGGVHACMCPEPPRPKALGSSRGSDHRGG